MNPVVKFLLFGLGAVILGISVWGWLQVLTHRSIFAEFDPHYRDCVDTRPGAQTEQACSLVLARKDLDPENRAKALIHRGITYNRTGRYRDAIRDFDGVLAATEDKSGPVALAALIDRSYSESMLGETAKAWADADRAVARAPDSMEGYEARSALHERAGQFALAAQDFDEPIRRKPEDSFAFNNRCWLRAIANELPGALTDCNKALTLDSRYWAAMDSRAFVYFKMGEYAKARDEYDAAVLAGSGAPATFYMRGVTKIRLGGTSGGIADIAYAKSLDPNVAERFAGYGVKP